MEFKNLIIFEMANNHMGDLSHGKKIIEKYSIFLKKYNYKFAFKLQFRDLDTFIRPDYKNREDLHYIKRFKDTRLNENQFKSLIKVIKKNKFKAISTPFDEKSVDLIKKFKLDYVKVASCSFGDWPLIEKISHTLNIPIILSTAGAKLDDIDNVVSFLKNRNKTFCLMHCVGEYPTNNMHLHLSQISFLRNRYQNIPIGYSSHEDPDNFMNINIALSQGATIFEKHVGIATNKYSLNKYSLNLNQTKKWLDNYRYTLGTLGHYQKSKIKNLNEIKSLNALKRGVFVKKNINKGDSITKKDVFFAFPPENNQLLANDFSKYLIINANKNFKKNDPMLLKNLNILNSRDKILDIKNKIVSFIKKSRVEIPKNIELEISHHYGIANFYKFGLSMFTLVNREYCKKILILLPNQTHPTQFHKTKEETFNILSGKLILILDGKKNNLKKGDILTIKPKQKHKFYSKTGCIIEELSTTHRKQDSFYIDKKIQSNKDRKTIINYWN